MSVSSLIVAWILFAVFDVVDVQLSQHLIRTLTKRYVFGEAIRCPFVTGVFLALDSGIVFSLAENLSNPLKVCGLLFLTNKVDVVVDFGLQALFQGNPLIVV
jgi:hypothetical protein